MLTLTINTDSVDIAERIVAFVASLDLERVSVDTVSSRGKIEYQPRVSMPEGDGFQKAIGMWKDREDVTATALRSAAWSRNASYDQ